MKVAITLLKTKYPTIFMGDIATMVKRPADLSETQIVQSVGVRWYGQGAYIHEEKSAINLRAARFEVKSNDLIYNDMWARNGSVAIVPQELNGTVASAHFPTWELDLDKVYPPFLHWYFQTPTFWADCEEKSQGSTGRNAITKTLFRQLVIPLPSLDEQQHVVAKIDELAQRIEELHGLRLGSIEETVSSWQSILDGTFSRLEDRYTTSLFEEICNVVRGGSPRPAGDPTYYDGSIPFLKVGDITKDDEMYLDTHTFTIKEAGLHKTRYVEADTLLLTNSGATLGVPKICTFPTTFNDGIQAFLGIPENISKEFLYYFLSSKTHYFRTILARGQGQPNLNTTMVKELSFPNPPIHVQLEIVQQLRMAQENIKKVLKLQKQILTELNALLPSILDKAFRGEL